MSPPVETRTGVKLILVAASLLTALVLIEFVVFSLLVSRTPLRLDVFLPEGAR